MIIFIDLYDEHNVRIKRLTPPSDSKESSGNPIVFATGDFFHYEKTTYVVVGRHWDLDEDIVYLEAEFRSRKRD